ncbi:MAG: hypothetical protein KGJ98_00120 [Chloroflexota bacterium]|nr:hypothetical protein [Chloroflexota bacterium]
MAPTAVPVGEDLRRTLAALADVVLEEPGLPAPSSVDVQGELLDRTLADRPDLRAPLTDLLAAAAGKDPAAEVRRLQRDDPRAFIVLANVVAGAYYMHPDVKKIIGYPGQTPRYSEEDPAEEARLRELLRPVIERGAIYRR